MSGENGEVGGEPSTRIRLDLAYDGTDFNGWAKQPGLRTVQGVVEGALQKLFRRHPDALTVVVAGRTDAGVHAAAQVVHVDLTPAQLHALRNLRLGGIDLPDAAAALAYRLNGILSSEQDVVVQRGRLAPAGFDARFSAMWRRYEYRISDALGSRDPAQRRRTTWLSTPLEVETLNRAAAALIGFHDFAAYCKAREGATTIRTLQSFEWQRDEFGVLVGRLQADAFCHSMVRALVGACVAVGDGRLAERDLALTLEVGERTNAFTVMPPRGLTLTEVGYPVDGELGARAEETRARREL